jgi:putative endonuclease
MSALPDTSNLWTVYMLRCSDGSLYTGITNDLARRVRQHGGGKAAAYTRSRRPVRLVFAESAADRSAALRREAALKRLSRAQKLALLTSRRLSPSSRRRGAPRSTAR